MIVYCFTAGENAGSMGTLADRELSETEMDGLVGESVVMGDTVGETVDGELLLSTLRSSFAAARRWEASCSALSARVNATVAYTCLTSTTGISRD
jgi:hypothetical protein